VASTPLFHGPQQEPSSCPPMRGCRRYDREVTRLLHSQILGLWRIEPCSLNNTWALFRSCHPGFIEVMLLQDETWQEGELEKNVFCMWEGHQSLGLEGGLWHLVLRMTPTVLLPSWCSDPVCSFPQRARLTRMLQTSQGMTSETR
jgi:hypothetical protein